MVLWCLFSGYKHTFVAADGFHKVTNIENGALRMEKDDMEFSHPYFLLGSEQMLVHIKRKVKCYIICL